MIDFIQFIIPFIQVLVFSIFNYKAEAVIELQLMWISYLKKKT